MTEDPEPGEGNVQEERDHCFYEARLDWKVVEAEDQEWRVCQARRRALP